MLVIRHSAAFIMAALLTLSQAACDSGQPRPGDSSFASPSAFGVASPVETPLASASAPAGQIPDADPFADVAARNLAKPIRVPADGFHYEEIRALNEREALLIGRSPETGASSVLRADLESGRLEEWLKTDRDIGSFELLSNAESETAGAQWVENDAETSDYMTFRRVGERTYRMNGMFSASPDGAAYAAYRMTEGGIWGIDAKSGDRMRWTKGENDEQPLWLPDGSGFVYLKDTGKQLGDGAGPQYALAEYDVASGKSKELPFDRGFWGRIGWLTPGKTILAENGFDDMIGLRIVDLQNGNSQQLVATSELRYHAHAYNPQSKELMVSGAGKLTFYSETGERLRSMLWPDGVDPQLGVNPAWDPQQAEDEPYYAAESGVATVGPSRFLFSPDGTKLVYALGAIGESIDDAVHGGKLVLASGDGSAPSALTPDFLRIMGLSWAPSSKRIAALIAPADGSGGDVYAGWIDIP